MVIQQFSVNKMCWKGCLQNGDIFKADCVMEAIKALVALVLDIAS